MNQTADQLRLEAAHCETSADDYLRSLARLMEQAANEMDPLFDNRRRERVRRNATRSFWHCAPRPELDELIKKSVAAFEALSPAEQEAEMQKQRESWARQDMD